MDVRLEKLRANVNLLGQMLDDVAQAKDGDLAVKTVHRLRTSTRRSGALLASLVGEGRAAAKSPGEAVRALRKDAARLERQWKKLRRAAGGVRDLDVHGEMVQELRAEAAKKPAVAAQAASRGVKANSETGFDAEWARLEAWLVKERHRRAEELKAEVAERGKKAAELGASVLQALMVRDGRAGASRRAAPSPAMLALEDFAAVSAEMPVLDRENLHDFRKRTKEARYLAEAGGETAEAATVARALKRIQDVIGEWHDRDALADEAEQALGKAGRALTEHLRQLAAAEMQRAVEVTERMRGRLLGERQALRQRRIRTRAQRAGGEKAPAGSVQQERPEKIPAQAVGTDAEQSRTSA